MACGEAIKIINTATTRSRGQHTLAILKSLKPRHKLVGLGSTQDRGPAQNAQKLVRAKDMHVLRKVRVSAETPETIQVHMCEICVQSSSRVSQQGYHVFQERALL
jgi:hypothetical protein